MDSIFFLDSDARRRFIGSAGRAFKCLYICLWSYIPQPSNFLVCMDGWFHEDDGGGQPSMSSGSRSHQLFDAYRRSFCSIQAGCVPGLAFKEGHPYLELGGADLMSSASLRIQQQFYQEAGVKAALFMGCQTGEIEIGMLAPKDMSLQLDIGSMFSDEFIQQSQLGSGADFPQTETSRPSSSSSSMRSLSVSSPECSSLLLNKPTTSYHADTYRHFKFPNRASDDAAMAKAMLAVISSGSSSSPSSSSALYQTPLPSRAQIRPAFEPYNPSLAPRRGESSTRHGQKMIKMAIAVSRKLNFMKFNRQIQETRTAPTTNQIHHMISERKRREKLNENFHALRSLLPPGCKKDKASVLSTTKEYLKTLKAQISELEEKNRVIEKDLLITSDVEDVGDASERVKVEVTWDSESSSRAQRVRLRITLREECDFVELVLRVLECFKAMGSISLVSMDARTLPQQTNLFARVTLALQIEGGDWDESSFKEAVTRALDGVVALPPVETTKNFE